MEWRVYKIFFVLIITFFTACKKDDTTPSQPLDNQQNRPQVKNNGNAANSFTNDKADIIEVVVTLYPAIKADKGNNQGQYIPGSDSLHPVKPGYDPESFYSTADNKAHTSQEMNSGGDLSSQAAFGYYFDSISSGPTLANMTYFSKSNIQWKGASITFVSNISPEKFDESQSSDQIGQVVNTHSVSDKSDFVGKLQKGQVIGFTTGNSGNPQFNKSGLIKVAEIGNNILLQIKIQK